MAIAPIIPIMADKHPKRPRDFSQAAKLVVDIASGQIEDHDLSTINESARRGGQKGGPARARKLTAEERRRIAQKAANARWKKDRPVPERTE